MWTFHFLETESSFFDIYQLYKPWRLFNSLIDSKTMDKPEESPGALSSLWLYCNDGSDRAGAETGNDVDFF